MMRRFKRGLYCFHDEDGEFETLELQQCVYQKMSGG